MSGTGGSCNTLRLLLMLAFHVVGLPHAAAQLPVATPTEQPDQQTATVLPEVLEPSLPSPHATLTKFFAASDSQTWADAARCLDFSELPDDLSQSVQNDLAFKLKAVLDRLEDIKLSDVPTRVLTCDFKRQQPMKILRSTVVLSVSHRNTPA